MPLLCCALVLYNRQIKLIREVQLAEFCPFSQSPTAVKVLILESNLSLNCILVKKRLVHNAKADKMQSTDAKW